MTEKITEELSQTPTFEHFNKIGINHHHGFCLPLFSIRSKNSAGIGEFSDLIYLIDFCNEVNMDVIQLLPLNEAYFKDPSPYNAISSCALDFIYISLHDLHYFDDDKILKHKLKDLKKFNHTNRVKHDKVRKKKFNWLLQYYNKYFDNYKNLDSYHSFVRENPWLKPYCVYRSLKDYYKRKKWWNWPTKYQQPTEFLIDAYYDSHRVHTEFYVFLQYLGFSQLSKVKNYATEKKVFLKGDVPILVNPDSVDVWFYRSIFNMKKIAGAPPDDFNHKGQRWGFPIFNWDVLKTKNYFWWKQKLSVLQNLYHIYRLDHAVGFFRIWAIDKKDKPIHGQFLPEDPSLWQVQGEELLQMLIKSSPLLPIAEDLGLLPPMVYSSLKKLGICGTKIPRWQRNIPLKDYEPLSLTTLSTHDTETMTEWWKSAKEEAQTLCITNNWKYTTKLTCELRKQILHDVHHSASLFHINLLSEYLALFPELIRKKPKDERINISGKVTKKNWTYRLKPSLEKLVAHEELKSALKEITAP